MSRCSAKLNIGSFELPGYKLIIGQVVSVIVQTLLQVKRKTSHNSFEHFLGNICANSSFQKLQGPWKRLDFI